MNMHKHKIDETALESSHLGGTLIAAIITKNKIFLMADDFYEYFQIAREMINFILIDRVIDIM